MTPLVPIAMYGWIPVLLFLFVALPPRRAVIAAFITGWLFLPEARFLIAGLPDYTKMSATTSGILLATILFDFERITRLRPAWIDIPTAIFVLCPFLSSINNGLGPYDGVSATLDRMVEWGFPYLIGRVYFTDARAIKELAIGIVIGGLVYVPLCLWEIRMSPQLHATLYGFSPSPFHNALRFDGFRPKVFLHSGLPLGLWMTTATLMAVWLWRVKLLPNWWGLDGKWWLLLLTVTTILCKSMGALALLALTLAALYVSSRFKTRWPVLVLACLPVLFIFGRVNGWRADFIVNTARMISENRAASFQFRIDNHDLLIDRARKRPITGWGGWGRNRVRNEFGRDIAVTDGMWVIYFGMNGYVGLVSMFGILLLPAGVFFLRMPSNAWAHPEAAAPIALATLPIIFAGDNLANAMPNPVFILATGAIAGFVAQQSWRPFVIAANSAARRRAVADPRRVRRARGSRPAADGSPS